ncbi:MAG: DUF4411 family protein [Methylacidiphilales bacterium]|nr:DUF4411 family protein [Candidatus Methylacidiphilales bacterium]
MHIIDTSSLISYCDYYLPLDFKKLLSNFLKEKIESKDILLIDKVIDESRKTRNGVVIKNLQFINNDTLGIKTIITKEDHELIATNFLNKKLVPINSKVNYITEKNNYINTADPALILYARKNNYTIITEEQSNNSNYKKIFNKIPTICASLKINCISMANYLKDNSTLKLGHFNIAE